MVSRILLGVHSTPPCFDTNLESGRGGLFLYADRPLFFFLIDDFLHTFIFQHRLLDIYAKFDVINLAAEKTYSNLNVSLKEANKHRNEWFEGVHKCKKSDSLYEVMDRIVKAEVHRLVIVDEDNVVCGMISLSDILNFLVLIPGGKLFWVFCLASPLYLKKNKGGGF